MSMEYEAVIGLECHVQLATESKAFGTASAEFGGSPNSYTDPYTLALPGTLPVLNEKAAEYAVRMGLACGCRIRKVNHFDRKHYFYPDLPKGYQITQNGEPVCEGGGISFLFQGQVRTVRLNRIHLEEDAGKNVHLAGTSTSLVDLNRAGVPLIEIVSEPDIRSAEEAAEYLREIRKIVRFLGISDGNMEEGSLRCDANVSIRPKGQTTFGTKVELKNINSFKYVQKAIEHEIQRQKDLINQGEKLVSETRGWDAEKGTSHSQRKKEEANDYRYFPEPDLPPLHLRDEWLEEVKQTMPETPMQRYVRYTDGLGLSSYDAGMLTAEPSLGVFFDQTLQASQYPDAKAFAKWAANWIGSELLGALNKEGKTIEQSPIAPAMLAELVGMVADSSINGKTAKEVFAKIYAEGGSPKEMVHSAGLSQVTDLATIEAWCQSVVQDPAMQKQIEKYRSGNLNLFGFFVGMVMKASKGRANPELVNETIKKLLDA